jgi:heme/copper-type cytochrome/quinol oxidase subunit 3
MTQMQDGSPAAAPPTVKAVDRGEAVDHGDTRGASAVFAAWLVVAATAMLFVGLLAAYAIFRIDKPGDFQRDGQVLIKATGASVAAAMLGGAIAVTLAAFALRVGRAGICRLGLFIALLGGALTLALIGQQAVAAAHHLTIEASVSSNPGDGNFIYDGMAEVQSDTITLTGVRVLLPTARRVDLHWILSDDLPKLVDPPAPEESGTYVIPIGDIHQQSSFFAGRNTFFACYYTTALMLCVSVLGGMIAALVGIVRSRPKSGGLIAGLAIYWSFLTVVWIVMLRLFYFA